MSREQPRVPFDSGSFLVVTQSDFAVSESLVSVMSSDLISTLELLRMNDYSSSMVPISSANDLLILRTNVVVVATAVIYDYGE